MKHPPPRALLTALLSAVVALALAAPATAALTSGAGPDPVPNPGPSGTPSPGPSHSPLPDPRQTEEAPSVAAEQRAAQDGQALARDEGAAFLSSFETGDPQPTWTDTTETNARGVKKAANVTGVMIGGIEGSISDQITRIDVSGEYAANGEVKENLADTDANTKWLVFTGTGWAQYDLAGPGRGQALRADLRQRRAPARPRATGSSRARRTGRPGRPSTPGPARRSPSASRRKEYGFANTTAYRTTGWTSPRTAAAPSCSSPSGSSRTAARAPRRRSDMRSRRRAAGRRAAGTTPSRAPASPARRPSSTRAAPPRRPAGTRTTRSSTSTSRSPPGPELSYLIFPELTGGRPALPEHVRLGRPGLHRRHLPERPRRRRPARRPLSPRGQGASKTLYANQWNHKSSQHRRRSRRGKTIDRILVGYDNPERPGRRSAAGSTTSRSPTRPRRRPTTAHLVRLRRSPPAAPTPAAASRAATTSRPPPCRTASTSGRR